MSIVEPPNSLNYQALIALFGTYLACFIIGGLCYSTGIYYARYIVLFPNKSIMVAITSSSPATLYFLLGPFSLWLTARIGPCLTISIGALTGTVGYLASAFLTSINLLCLTQGILLGVGCGLVMAPTFCHFKLLFPTRHYAVANALTLSGLSLGYFVFPYILEAFIDSYGIGNSLLITSAIYANTFAVAITFYDPAVKRPIFSVKLSIPNKEWLDFFKLKIQNCKNIVKPDGYSGRKLGSDIINVIIFMLYAFLEQAAGSIFIVMLPNYLLRSNAVNTESIASTLISLTALGDFAGSISIVALGFFMILTNLLPKKELSPSFKETTHDTAISKLCVRCKLLFSSLKSHHIAVIKNFSPIYKLYLFFITLIIHLVIYGIFLVKKSTEWTLPQLRTIVLIYGHSYGARWALTNPVLIDMYGGGKFSKMTGHYFTAAGLGSLCGVTMATWFSSRYNNETIMFYITTTITLCAITCYFKLFLIAFHKSSDNKEEGSVTRL